MLARGDHVSQTLVVDDSNVKVGLHQTPRYTTVEGPATIVVITGSLELLVSKVIDGYLVARFVKCKRRSVLEMPVQGNTLPSHAL
jgi:hypothetical protein